MFREALERFGMDAFDLGQCDRIASTKLRSEKAPAAESGVASSRLLLQLPVACKKSIHGPEAKAEKDPCD